MPRAGARLASSLVSLEARPCPFLISSSPPSGAARIEVVDLTAPLESTRRSCSCRSRSRNTIPFALREISRYDDRGPAWYWNDIHTGEHTGTHFDAPGALGHRPRRPGRLAGPVRHAGRPGRGDRQDRRVRRRTRTSCWRSSTSRPGGRARPAARRRLAALPHRLGRAAHDQADFLNADENGPHTPGISAECAQWLAEQTSPLIGFGVETVGTDAGAAHGFDPPFPCHSFLLGADKYGLTQLRNLGRLPATGAVLIVSPLPIVGGSGSPARVLALVERSPEQRRRARRLAARPARRRARVRGGRQRQLPRHQRPVRGRGAVRRDPARGRRGDAWPTPTPGSPAGVGGAVGAPGLRAHQRADRHHRGGQEPHPAAGAGRRHRRGGGAVELPDRPGRAGRGGRRGGRAGATVGDRPSRRPGVPHGGSSAAPSCSTCRSTSRPASAPAGRGASAARPTGPAPRPRAEAALGSPTGAAGGRCSSPAAARAARRADLGRWRRVGGALLATSAVAQRAVRRRAAGPGRLRRVRHPAGRRADRRRRPGGRAGARR